MGNNNISQSSFGGRLKFRVPASVIVNDRVLYCSGNETARYRRIEINIAINSEVVAAEAINI